MAEEILGAFRKYAVDDDTSPYTQMNRDTRQALLPSLERYISYLLTQDLDDIQQAVRYAQEASESAAPDVQAGASIRWHLGRTLLRRFQHTKQAEDVTEAIDLLQIEALQTDDESLGQKCLGYLSIAYTERDGDLDGFSKLNRPAVESQSRPLLETFTHKLGEHVEVLLYFTAIAMIRAARYVSPRDLDFEIRIAERALFFLSYYPTSQGKTMVDLGGLLVMRWGGREIPRSSGESGKLDDISGAISCYGAALELKLSSETLMRCLLAAADACHTRYSLQGGRKDLDDAMRFSKRAEDLLEAHTGAISQKEKLLEERHKRNLTFLMFLQADILDSRYKRTRDLNDLDAAIECSIRAIDSKERPTMLTGDEQNCSSLIDLSAVKRTSAVPESVPMEVVPVSPALLMALATLLSLRYNKSGRAKDLSEAIRVAQRAVDLTPPKHPTLVGSLTDLGAYELHQFSRLSDSSCLERGLRHIREAEAIAKEIPEALRMAGHAGSNVRWAGLLTKYIEHLGEKELDRAIATLQDGTTEGIGFVQGVGFRISLGAALIKRWERRHNREDIDEAINVLRQLTELRETAPDQSVDIRRNLGAYLCNRHVNTGHSEDLQEALVVLLEGVRTVAGNPRIRVDAGDMAMRIFCKWKDWASARKISLEILDIFMILNGRALNWQDKQSWLRLFGSLASASNYASIALEAGCDVIQVIDTLETCRGAILGHLIDINDLVKVAPDKAQHFRNLQNEINVGSELLGMTNTLATQTAKRIQAESEIRDCLAEIRTLEGFQTFLRGPTHDNLKAAAAQGHIIVINVSGVRSDAIIITKDDFIILPLPGLTIQRVLEYIKADLTNFCIVDFAKKNKEYRELQEWLWANCVKLVIEKLDTLTSGLQKHRVCWIGIGLASSLPFHAAGNYMKSTTETALSRIISTYTSTLKVLIYGQRQLRNKFSKQKLQAQCCKTRLAVVSMHSTPGHRNLEGAKQEAEKVLEITQSVFSTSELLQPSAKHTMAHMAECEIVHFACHGESTLPDLSSSHLLLQATTPGSADPEVDKLTLKDVADSSLSCGTLAFLSACSTAHDQDRSFKLLDEALHLVSGFQVAGYLHTVGNRWPSDDEVSVEVVEGFYRHLVAAGEFGNGENIATSLNEALQEVARKYAKQPLYWAQFVHFGILM